MGIAVIFTFLWKISSIEHFISSNQLKILAEKYSNSKEVCKDYSIDKMAHLKL